MKFLLFLTLLTVGFQPILSQHHPDTGKIVYQSGTLTITQVAPSVFIHTSFLSTDTYGKVPCNGMIVRSLGETVVFDTPATDRDAEELLLWIRETLHCKINAVVPTHFHEDCLGGLRAFERRRIPSYANAVTIAYAAQHKFNVPQRGFTNNLTLKVGRTKVYTTFYGEGHTLDNVVGYFPDEKVLFGGCLIKELDAGKGNLADANVRAWPATVAKVRLAYPDVQVVIPGHGQAGDRSLLDYTIRLFQQP